MTALLSVSPQRLWAKDTEGLPKWPFKPLILKGEKHKKCRSNGKVPGRPFCIYKLLILLCRESNFSIGPDFFRLA